MYSTVVAPTAHSLLLFAPRCSALMTATEMPTADTANFDNCIQFSTAIRSIRYEWIENPLIFTSSLTHQRNWLRVSYKCLEKSFSPSLPSSQAFFGCVARTHDCLLVATVEHICLVGVWCVYTWVYTEQAHTHTVFPAVHGARKHHEIYDYRLERAFGTHHWIPYACYLTKTKAWTN